VHTELMRAPLVIFQLTSKRIWSFPNVRGLGTRDTLLPPCFIEISAPQQAVVPIIRILSDNRYADG
jgi:hypothetical protein